MKWIALFAVIAVAAYFLFLPPSSQNASVVPAKAPVIESAGTPSLRLPTQSKGVTTAKVAPATIPGSHHTLSTHASELVPESLRNYPLDEAKEKFILESNLSPNSKRILLSEMILTQNKKSMDDDDYALLKRQLRNEIKNEQSELADSIKSLISNPSSLPSGVPTDLVASIADMTPFRSPELEHFSEEQLKVSTAEYANGGETQSILESMVALGTTTENAPSTWQKIETSIPAQNQGLLDVMHAAQHTIQMKQRP